MAAKSRGSKLSPLVLQPGAIITDEQDYSTKGHAVYVGDRSAYGKRPKRGDPHPLDKNCLLYAVQTTALKLQKIQCDCDYIGLSADPTPYFLEFVGSVGEEAIETHPNFVSTIGGTPDTPLHGAQFDETSGEFLGFPVTDSDGVAESGNLGGVRTYYRPSVIVRLSYWTREMPNPGPLGHVFEADSIDGLVLPSNCLNLLVTNLGYRTITPKQPPYQVTVEALASGINGWNELIYPYA